MNDPGSQNDRHVIMWRAYNEIYQLLGPKPVALMLTPAAIEPDEIWHARVLTEAKADLAEGKANRCPPLDPFSDPTLTLRVQQATDGDEGARRTLLRIARDALDVGRVNDLPLPVRLYLIELRAANGGELPVATGGRPSTAWKPALAVAVVVERVRGLASDEALGAVAKLASSRETIRKAHNSLRNSRKMKVELARRHYEAEVDGLDQLPPVDLKALRQLDQAMGKAPRRKLPKAR